MPIVGIQLRHCGPAIYCDSMPLSPIIGAHLMVETENGLLLGRVISLHDSLPDGSISSGIAVLRAATDADRAA
ncbi:MAG: hypothetical protein FWG59_05060, partial [Betaproteobacteria bacterium]|nr:hypothetical protein [Betaproteobacteria bacterium]